jgi:hypothetical protein
MITRCSCKTVSNDGGRQLVALSRASGSVSLQFFKERMGDFQFTRRPIIDLLIGREKGV